MIALISENLPQIGVLCEKYGIRRLDLFGSAAAGGFNPETSDIDMLCDLGEYEPGVADRLFAFADALEDLLGRKVDLLTVPMIRNPYFRQAITEQRVKLYEARDRQAAA